MQNQNIEILSKALEWLQNTHCVLLITVIKTWGSSPRPPGSLMALRDDGHISGSISGGCIEDDLIQKVRTEGIPNTPERLSYGVDSDQANRFGLPCGGQLQLVCEPLNSPDEIKTLVTRLNQGEKVARYLTLSNGASQLKSTRQNQKLELAGDTFMQVFGPQHRLLIIGAGQISSLLAQIALSLDYSVLICDPRREYHDEWAVSGTTLLRSMPDDSVIEMKPDSNTAIVALTHDPKLDDMALIEALASPAFYVAALGSRLNNDRRRERLALFDLTPHQISQLKGPAGLDIGSRTPAEIAVSIAADLIATKNQITTSPV